MRALVPVQLAVLGVCCVAAACARGGSTSPSSAPLELAVAGRANAHVSLAADGDRVAAVWLASAEEGSDVYAAVSADGGRRFATPVRVNEQPGDAAGNGEQPPRVALRDGLVTVIWVSKRDGVSGIRGASSSDGGRRFGATRTISPAGLTGARGWESVAMSEDGVVHVAWLDGRHAAAMPAGAHEHGAVPMRQDIVHAMWRGDDPIVESPVADNVCFCCKTAVVVRGSDVYVAWRHLFDGGVRDIAVARSADGGRSFGGPVRVSADNWKIDACPDDGPSMAVDTAGQLRVAWPTLLPGGAEARMGVFEASSADGGRTFTPRVRVDASAAGAGHPRLAVAGADRAVVWDEFSGGGRRVMFRRGGGAARTLGGTGLYPAVAASGGGYVVAWTEPRGGGSVVRALRLDD